MNTLPVFFKPILWSYDFTSCNPRKMKKTIISQSLNYGSTLHWKWIKSFYGQKEVFLIFSSLPKTEIKEKTRKLAELYFS
ncbi:MAG: hypothetical protein US45_C0061G0005 [Candidatus Nomurabacteria bacterium GW2011_GWA1_37_20]|uniref:DUF6922 domain-containing protein n=1 Tax=Candidatus Nomurabacteria bacterium GW2011_GWA1_37_20 TaxID=1618729 RepID=A0A0G0JN05_9BACT|nr:MAG: hypothetical protein US33_C0039G0007 [Parcubacteria group bacterium GW2011_GWC1_36_9]KKQ25497.1 MAG: hypothetical protein US41_C0043G0007 [Parcubacteria group bacterium GW2011_GWB1_37_13]KKQ29381.1 MAG: hypothetical protein US45_C0061G0005 [Candidatus Nomurabacteria bacterium GW2011_GWA1_37_20]